jgi:hypothetical protein
VYWYPHTFDGRDDDIWGEGGQAIGNLQKFETLSIITDEGAHFDEDDGEDEDPRIFLYRAVLVRITKPLRHNVSVNIDCILSFVPKCSQRQQPLTTKKATN